MHDFIQEDMQENAGAEYAVVLITDFQTSEPKKEEAYQYADQLREMGVSVVIISPQGPKQKRDDSFKNAFADRAGAVKTLDANNEQQLSKAYIDTFIQLASCYACYPACVYIT